MEIRNSIIIDGGFEKARIPDSGQSHSIKNCGFLFPLPPGSRPGGSHAVKISRSQAFFMEHKLVL
jgi:hypothetical protein